MRASQDASNREQLASLRRAVAAAERRAGDQDAEIAALKTQLEEVALASSKVRRPFLSLEWSETTT